MFGKLRLGRAGLFCIHKDKSMLTYITAAEDFIASLNAIQKAGIIVFFGFILPILCG